ncbi:MAG: polyprenol monophosphomannose synthase [Candidatus Omnitrophica bacterium]|nr:polyprenol monophosphomannose synthase [Candidatus Omnitrophota bacterium]
MFSKNKKIIVIVPTYNEVGNIAVFIDKIFVLTLDVSILIVDDNSPDGTSQEVKKIKIKYYNLFLITRNKKLGLGSAYIEGFKYALENKYEVIVQMDADLSHDPKYILDMVNLLDNKDLVVGSRYFGNGGVLNWPLGRVLLSKGANVFAKKMLGVPINDLTSGFRCLRSNVLEKIKFESIECQGYGFQIEMVYELFLNGFRICEYPIVFEGRRYEESKMTASIAFEAFFRVLVLFSQRVIRFLKNF